MRAATSRDGCLTTSPCVSCVRVRPMLVPSSLHGRHQLLVRRVSEQWLEVLVPQQISAQVLEPQAESNRLSNERDRPITFAECRFNLRSKQQWCAALVPWGDARQRSLDLLCRRAIAQLGLNHPELCELLEALLARVRGDERREQVSRFRRSPRAPQDAGANELRASRRIRAFRVQQIRVA